MPPRPRSPGWVAAAVVLLLGSAQGAPSMAYAQASTATLSLLPQASIPLQLARGPGDTTTELNVALSASLTGSRVANSRPGNYDALYVNNTASTDYRMRLVLVGVTNQSDCVKCALWVSNLSSGAKRVHLNVTSGSVQQATGPWENLTRNGTSGDEYHVWAEHDVASGKEVKVAYALEYSPRGAASPTVQYANMTFVGRGVIAVTNNLFTPATFTIRAGDSVTWRWVEGRHGVEDLSDNLWCSERTAPASDCSRSFPTAGLYAYRCTRHAAMLGTITVSAT